MDRSETTTEIIKALVKIQPVLKPAIKDKTNPFLKSKYADLSGVWDCCRELLKENKLAVVQVGGIDANGCYLETILMHESGEWISGRYPLKPVKSDDPQAMGSALTYARRYTLAAILGIVTEDDDAEGAMGRVAESKAKYGEKPRPTSSYLEPPRPATAEQLNKLEVYQKAGKNIKSIVDLYKWTKVKKISDLTYEQAETTLRHLDREVKNGQPQ